MNRAFPTRSYVSLGLLLIAASAFVAGIKSGVADVNDAAFLPVAIFAVFAGYLLGAGPWSSRRAWLFIAWFGLLVIFLEASRVREVLWQSALHSPSFEWSAFLSLIHKEAVDLSYLQHQWSEVIGRVQYFLAALSRRDGEPSLVLREVLWDLPLLLCCAWSGWWSSRHHQVLTAMGPSLVLHGLILNYTEKSTLTLQIAAFSFIFLMGVQQNWSVPKRKSASEDRVRNETYAALFVLSFLLMLAAGWIPVFSIRETARRIAEQREVNETLGLERKVAQSYTVSSSGLPREHLINTAPQNLRTVVFTANTGELPSDEEGITSAPRYYWRWLTYDLYNGKGWSTSPITSDTYSADETLFSYNGDAYRVIHQTIKKASADNGRLYWTGTLMRASQPFESTWRMPPAEDDPLLHMDMLGSLTEAQQYSADSLIPQLSETQLRGTPQTYPRPIREKYLSLPQNISPRVLDLAHQLTAQSDNAYDKAKTIEAYLRTYPYTLDVPSFPPDKEIADYFLFELKKGYCDYYATSMVVLARAADLPARLVIGYVSGEYDTHTAQYTIREVNAHSWVEVYFPEIGWVEFEPTAGQPAIERPLNAADSNGLTLSETVLKNRNGMTYGKHAYFIKRNPLPSITVLFFLIVLACLWVLRKQGLRFSYTTIASIYEWVYFHGNKIYKEAAVHQTPLLFAEKLKIKLGLNRRFLYPAAGELDQLTALYLKETYSPHPITKNEQEQAVKVWRKLFWRLLYARMVVN
jgi:transglutaminase-like putative cysteine protease